MANDQGDTEKLLARAAAAIAEAKQLLAKNVAWQAEIHYRLRLMITRTVFHPRSLRFYSPADFPEPKLPYQPFPNETDS